MVVRLEVGDRLVNSFNGLHGGAAATLVDVVGSIAIITADRDSRSGVSTDLNDWIGDRAEELGISKARVVGAMLRFAREHENQVAYPQAPSRRDDQQELPLSQAS